MQRDLLSSSHSPQQQGSMQNLNDEQSLALTNAKPPESQRDTIISQSRSQLAILNPLSNQPSPTRVTDPLHRGLSQEQLSLLPSSRDSSETPTRLPQRFYTKSLTQQARLYQPGYLIQQGGVTSQGVEQGRMDDKQVEQTTLQTISTENLLKQGHSRPQQQTTMNTYMSGQEVLQMQALSQVPMSTPDQQPPQMRGVPVVKGGSVAPSMQQTWPGFVAEQQQQPVQRSNSESNLLSRQLGAVSGVSLPAQPSGYRREFRRGVPEGIYFPTIYRLSYR